MTAVITGLGTAAPGGADPAEYWKSVTDGVRRIGPPTQFDASGYATTLAGEVHGFDPAEVMDRKIAVQTDRWTWLGFAACGQALAHAELDPSEQDPYSLAIALASSSGGNQFGQKELQRLWSQPERTVGAYQSIAWFYAASVGQLSIRHGVKGPSTVLASEAAGGLDSIAHAVRLIRRGTSAVLAGGTECTMSPYALVCQERSGRLSTGTDPETAYAPFDEAAAGFVPAEGGGALLVEDLDTARGRGAPEILAEVAGAASTHDGETGRDGGSVRQYARAVRLALSRAGVRPADVDVVFPDALGVQAHDAVEAAGLREVFGPAGPAAVTTQKPLFGRSHQGSAALDAITAVLAMREGVLPASAGPVSPAPGCDLRFVTENRDADVRVALVVARGYDGFNSALVLRRHDTGGQR